MSKRFFQVIGVSAFMSLALSLPSQDSLAQTSPRTVKNAVVQIITGDDGKDDVDVFTITVSNADGKVLERVFDAKEEIKPGTTFNLWLNRIRPDTADKVKGSKITFRIDPKWDEHWVIKDARLTVNYDNGPAERWHWGPFVLQHKGAGTFQVEYTLDDASRVQ